MIGVDIQNVYFTRQTKNSAVDRFSEHIYSARWGIYIIKLFFNNYNKSSDNNTIIIKINCLTINTDYIFSTGLKLGLERYRTEKSRSHKYRDFSALSVHLLCYVRT